MFNDILDKLYTWKQEQTSLDYQGRPAQIIDLEFFQRVATVKVMNLDGSYSPMTMNYDEATLKLHVRD